MGRVVAVHPKVNLLKRVASDLFALGDEMEKATVIFPHRRPITFLEHYLGDHAGGAPLLLPRLRAFEDWVKEVVICGQNDPLVPLDDLDQAWLAYGAAQEVLEENEDLQSWGRFFPWAKRLVGLLRECDLELCSPKDLIHPPEGIPQMASELLGKVGSIFEGFNRLLRESGYTTPAKQLRALAEGEVSLPEGPFFLVGFYALTKAEDALFRRIFQERDATVYWHSNPKDLPRLHQEWGERWNVEVEALMPQEERNTRLHLFEAYDLHSELKELKNHLPSKIPSDPDKWAVVLPASDPLIPLLHHLPEGVNVTMGYPLRMTGLFVFLESLFQVVTTKDPDRGYLTAALLDLFRSPYLGNKDVENALSGYRSPFIQREKLEELGENGKEAVRRAMQVIESLEGVLTPKDLADVLESLLEDMGRLGATDREVAAAVVRNLLLPIKGALFAEEEMEPKELIGLFTDMLSGVSLPLEGEPLQGLQVMGLLESRLLSFENVILLEVNEGVLPKVEEVNPLIPFQVRKALGLPIRTREEEIFRYHFRRLLDSAMDAHLFWQLQTTPVGEAGLEGKKVRSRFVEELVWEMEKERGHILSQEDDVVKKARFSVLPQGIGDESPPRKSPEMRGVLLRVLEVVSPSLFNTYLECPLRFLYQRVLKLNVPKVEGDEQPPDRLGTAVHSALKRFYLELSGDSLPKEITTDLLDIDLLMGILKEELKKEEFYRHLSSPRRKILLETSRFRLERHLKQQKDTMIEALEEQCGMPFKGDIETTLKGILDRVDNREGIHLVLDYKTGGFGYTSAKKAVELKVDSEWELNDEGIQAIYQALPNLQLPFYVYLFGSTREISFEKITAGYIVLNHDGREHLILDPVKEKELLPIWAEWIKTDFPNLLEYLLRHIVEAPYWYPATNEKVCGFCDYRNICRYAL
jgi:ATP-dependent helicase/nuclease subunit B